MQDNMNDPSHFFAGRPVAGRLVSTRPSRIGGIRGWYEKQNVAIQVGIAIVAIFIPLFTFLLAITSLSARTPTTQPQSFNSLDSLATPVVPTSVPTVMPTPSVVPTPTAMPVTPTPLPDTIANPWGYDFVPGSFITAPPANFCIYFSCITNFHNGQGYVVECKDGAFSLSGGVAGSCADHKGDLRPLYFHPAPPPAPVPTPTPKPIPPTPTPRPQPTPTPIPPTPTPRPQPTPTPIPPTPTSVVQPIQNTPGAQQPGSPGQQGSPVNKGPHF